MFSLKTQSKNIVPASCLVDLVELVNIAIVTSNLKLLAPRKNTKLPESICFIILVTCFASVRKTKYKQTLKQQILSW